MEHPNRGATSVPDMAIDEVGQTHIYIYMYIYVYVYIVL